MLHSVHRHYRKGVDETPTHTGGLSREARERLEERQRRDRERGIYSSSSKSNKHDERKHDRDRGRESNYKRRGNSFTYLKQIVVYGFLTF